MQAPKLIQAPTGKILSDGEPQLAEGHYDLGLAIRDNPIAGGRFTGNVPTMFVLPAAKGQSGMDGYFSADRSENYDSDLSEFQAAPERMTPEIFLNRMEGVMQDAYSPEAMKQLDESDNYTDLEKRQFRSQIIHDTMAQNPSLLEYFEEYYPTFVEDVSEKFYKDEVTVGRGDQGQRILAGSRGEETQPFNIDPLVAMHIRGNLQSKAQKSTAGTAIAFDKEDIRKKVSRENMIMLGMRSAFGAAEVVGAAVDLFVSPEERIFEGLSTYGSMAGLTPSQVANWHNWMFRNNRIIGENRGELFSQERIDSGKITWGELSSHPNAGTFTDHLFNDAGRLLNKLGIEGRHGPYLKVAPEGVTPEGSVAGPGRDPVGQGPTGLEETALGMAAEIAGFRLVIEIGKAGVRKANKLFDKKTGTYNWGEHYAKIDTEINESGSFVGRALGSFRKGSADASRNIGRTMRLEQIYGAASLSAVEMFNSSSWMEDSPRAKLLTSMLVGVTAPLIVVATGRTVGSLGYASIAGWADQIFDPQFAEIAEILGAGPGNTRLGRNTERALGKTLSSFKAEDPVAYERMMRGHVVFKQHRQKILDGLTAAGASPETVERLGKIISGSAARGTTLAVIDSARHAASAQGDFGKGKLQKRLLSGVSRGRWGSRIEQDMRKAAELESLHDGQIEAVRGYGAILEELTIEITKLENDGIGVPQAMRELAIDMRAKHADMLGLPDQMLGDLQDALLEVYDINKKMNLRSSDPDSISRQTAEERLEIAFNRLPEKTQILFADELNEQFFSGVPNTGYEGIVGLLGKMEGVQRVIGEQKGLVDTMYSPLQKAGYVGSSDEGSVLTVSRPAYGATRRQQTTLMDQVYAANKRQSDANYAALYDAAGDASAVSSRDLLVGLNTKIQELGLDYGSEGLRTAMTVLNGLADTNPAFGKLIKLMEQAIKNPDEAVTISPDAIEKLSAALEPLTLKQAVQMRSQINSQAFKLGNRNDSTSRRGAAILHDMSGIVSTRIEYAAPEGSVLAAGLKNANTFYRENVADLFFDRYVRSSLRSDSSVTSPFETAFSQATLRRNLSAQENTPEGEIFEGTTQTRRDIYDRMFPTETPEQSKIRAQADEEMRGLMLRRIFGETETTGRTRAEFVQRLRILAVGEKSPMFQMKSEGGFLDVFFKSEYEAQEFLRAADVAPTVKSNAKGDDVFSAVTRRMFGRMSEEEFVNDPLFNSFTSKGDEVAIARVIKEMGKKANIIAQKDRSITIGIFADLFPEGKQNLSAVADDLLGEILKRTDKSGASLNSRQVYLGLLDDVREAFPDIDGLASPEFDVFKKAMRAKIVDAMVQKSTAVGAIDPEKAGIKTQRIEAVGFQELRGELETHGPLYREVLGETNYEGVVGLIKLASVSENYDDLMKYSQGLNQMTDAAALSRMWGVARGVVSLKYVGSEWLLRSLASKKNKALIEILSVPGFAEYVLDGVDSGRSRYSAYDPKMGFSRQIIPAMVGVLSEGESREHHNKTAQALYNFFEAAKNAPDADLSNPDFNLISLLIASRNSLQLEILASEAAREN
tara:strand:+ start:2736 stop:7406 length:4671 start_codon:yes stop_codon:yes gene_type:complete